MYSSLRAQLHPAQLRIAQLQLHSSAWELIESERSHCIPLTHTIALAVVIMSSANKQRTPPPHPLPTAHDITSSFSTSPHPSSLPRSVSVRFSHYRCMVDIRHVLPMYPSACHKL
jgi:hypothetical protein